MGENAQPSSAFRAKRTTEFFLQVRGSGTKVPSHGWWGATEATMSGIDPWEKAVDCERALQAASDPQQKKILKNLRYLWIALANECDVMSADEFARESEVIGRLHVELALLDRPSLH
ncbi:MAG: hypothetical protein ACXU9D_20885 [Xanthobacteraceae bacterium]